MRNLVSRVSLRAILPGFPRCRLCQVRVGPGERTCAEHTSEILSEAEMAALYAEAMRGGR